MDKNNFKIGDKVIYKNQHKKGIVTEIKDNYVRLNDSKKMVHHSLLMYEVLKYETNGISIPTKTNIGIFGEISGIRYKEESTPNHYKGKNGKQVFDVLEDFLTDENVKGFYVGNIIKYVLRYEKKNGIEDLEKAKNYIDKLIEKIGETK